VAALVRRALGLVVFPQSIGGVVVGRETVRLPGRGSWTCGKAGQWRHDRQGLEAPGPAKLVEHVRDGRDAGDGVLAEGPAVRVGTDQFVVDVDGAAAHARHRPGVIEQWVGRANQHEVLVGAKILEDVDDLDIEAFGLRATEDGEAVPAHAGLDLAHGHGGDARSRCGICTHTEYRA